MNFIDKNGLIYIFTKIKSLIADSVADKADSSHFHAAGDITSGTLDSARLPTVPISSGGTGATTAATARANLEITPENIGAATVEVVTTNYNESIIGLSVDGQTITYIKGDGSVHTFETQDTDTTYSLATDEVTGLTRLYATTGSAEDGTMTQKAICTELDKKVGVTIDATQNTLIFTK